MPVSNEKANLTVSFSKEKLEALKFYMQEKGTTVEKELDEYMKNIYEKHVPAPTRRYLGRNDLEDTPHIEVSTIIQGEDAETQTEETTQTSQTRGRRRNTRTQIEQNEGSIEAENQEQTEEMSMNM